MTSATPVPGGPSPSSWAPMRHAAGSANSERRPGPPLSRCSGNSNVRRPGSGVWTNWPRTRTPPGPTLKG
jgi:hypothetical protein